MLRRDTKYGSDMKKRVAEFTAGLSKTSIPAADQSDLQQKLASYQRDFFTWMDVAVTLQKELKATSDAYASAEPVIDALQQAVEKSRNAADAANSASRAATTLQMQIAIGCVILAVAAFAFFIGRAISKPLAAMARAMGLLAAGDFAAALPGLNRADEIGEMARSVEAFKIKAAEKARLEAQAKQAEDARAAEQRKADMRRLANEFESAVGGIIGTVSSASTELEAAATTLTKTAETTQQ
ncbi:MAG: HAMP domain-containing protein, partial [Proteobacteria bacterium]|nr:HAMP domain-containing protein [Pseudomonadota bacterium]